MALARITTSRARKLAKRIPSRAARRQLSATEPRAAVLAYRKLVRVRIDKVQEVLERLLFPVLEQFVEGVGKTTEPSERFDANLPRYVGARLEATELHFAELFDDPELVEDLGVIGKRVATKNGTALKRVVGIAIREADPGVAAQIVNFRSINVNRIKSLVGEQLVQITQLLEAAEATGIRVEVLRKSIQERFNVSRSKADLLARDQVLKLNAQITKTRQTNLGIQEFIWTTAGDDRVRGLDPKDKLDHSVLDGETFRWDTGADVGDGRFLTPGEDFQCRCIAFPVLVELDE